MGDDASRNATGWKQSTEKVSHFRGEAITRVNWALDHLSSLWYGTGARSFASGGQAPVRKVRLLSDALLLAPLLPALWARRG